MFTTKTGFTDKLKRAAIAFALLVLVQFALAGTAATAEWWRATAQLFANSAERLAQLVDTAADLGNDATAQ